MGWHCGEDSSCAAINSEELRMKNHEFVCINIEVGPNS